LGLSLWEFLGLADKAKWKTLRWEGFAGLGIFVLPWALPIFPAWVGQDAVLWGLFLMTLSFLWSDRPVREMIASVGVTFFGVAYFGVLGRYFFLLRDLPQGAWHLLVLYVATWAYDTGGYFGGRFFGKHHFAPLASPKKTVEGCVAGFLLVLAGLFLLSLFMGRFPDAPRYGAMDLLVLSALLSFFGQLGDLVESLIKRSFAAKDSGSLLPGHGGVFDRIDSLLFNAPILYFYLSWFQK
jgi:phosphatidate cytidylyltransferase